MEVAAPSAALEVLATLVLGVVLGVAWQCIFRRDVVERLFPVTALFLVALSLALALPGGQITLEPGGSSMTAVGIVMGLVLAETWLRSRDRAS